MEGCVLANEVLDSFPVHVLEVARRGDCQEVYVDLEGRSVVEVLGPISEDALAVPSSRGAAYLEAGNRFEVCLQLDEWFAQASRALRRGCLFAVDDGDLEPYAWLRQPCGSVESPGPEGLSPSPLENPGRKDITARVNFSAVLRAANARGRPTPFPPAWG